MDPLDKPVISILGSSGGVAKAILALLNQSAKDRKDPIHTFMKTCTFHLVDHKQRNSTYYEQKFPHISDRMTLHQFDLRNLSRFKQHLKDTATTHVIDVSWADTANMLQCCHEFNVHYMNTALENVMVDENEELEGFTLLERFRIFEAFKAGAHYKNMKAIIGSGMNPGVVQWMALELMKQAPGEKPLGCYIVEHDSSFYKDKSIIRPKTVYSTWSVECFLDEALLNYPMFVQNQVPLFLYHDVYEVEFKVRLAEKQFHGCLMPHEEVLTLSRLYDFETGFIYRVNEYTTETIRSNLGHPDELWSWKHQILDPADADMTGEDLVGVLLVYRDKERFMYNVMDNQSAFAAYGTNATYLQVACGIYGALCTLLLDELPSGIFYVDELLTRSNSLYGKYVSYYMRDFITGENRSSDGLLLNRMKQIVQ